MTRPVTAARFATFAAVALAFVLAAPAAHAQAPGEPPSGTSAPATLTVTGTAEVQVDPDHATFLVVTESQQPDSSAAASDDARLTRAVTGALHASGATADQVHTVSYTVQPRWRYSSNAAPERIGYQALTTLQVQVPALHSLGPWIDAALSAGASRIEDIELLPKDFDGARRQALALAVQHARADAMTLAVAAGGRLGALQSLSSGASSGVRPLPQPFLANAADRAADATAFQPGPLHITATVVGRWVFAPGS